MEHTKLSVRKNEGAGAVEYDLGFQRRMSGKKALQTLVPVNQ